MIDLASPMNSMVIGALISILVSGVFFSYERGVEKRDRERDWYRTVLNTTHQILKKLQEKGEKTNGAVVLVPNRIWKKDIDGLGLHDIIDLQFPDADTHKWDPVFVSGLNPLFLRLKTLVAGAPNPPDLELLEEVDQKTDQWMTLFGRSPYRGVKFGLRRTPDQTIEEVLDECAELHEMVRAKLDTVNSRSALQLLWYK
jgi:hypothetical protein